MCNVTASSVRRYSSNPDGGFVGYSGVSVKNNALFVSYNSTVDPNPTPVAYKVNGMVASNGAITAGNNSQVKGGVTVGPGGSISIPYTGARTTEALTPPTMPAWSPGANPGGVASSYSVSGNTT